MRQLSPRLWFDINLRYAKQKYARHLIIQEIKEERWIKSEIKEEEIAFGSIKIKTLKVKEQKIINEKIIIKK